MIFHLLLDQTVTRTRLGQDRTNGANRSKSYFFPAERMANAPNGAKTTPEPQRITVGWKFESSFHNQQAAESICFQRLASFFSVFPCNSFFLDLTYMLTKTRNCSGKGRNSLVRLRNQRCPQFWPYWSSLTAFSHKNP